MRSRTIFATFALVAAACDSDPTAPRVPTSGSPLPAASIPSLNSVSYIANWTHTILPLLPNVQGANAYGAGINHDGTVAGYVEGQFDGHWFTAARATVWTAAGPQNLGVMPPGSPSQSSYATAVNDGGTVTGYGTTAGSTGLCCVTRGFRWTQAGGMQPLVPPTPSDAAMTRGHAINVMGHVAGMYRDGAGVFHGVVWYDPAVPPIVIAAGDALDINDVGQVVGRHSGGAFVWSAQDGLVALPNFGSSWAAASAINNLGVVVGWAELPDGTIHPFRWTPSGGIEDLGLPPGAKHAYARDITKSGRILVTAEFHDEDSAQIGWRLFLLADGQWIDLGPANFGDTHAGGINEKLQIAGWGISGPGMNAVRWDVTLTPAAPSFTFTGFFAPIQNLPVVNRAKAGQGIPVKFSLGGNQGLDIFAPGFPASQQIACDGSAPIDEVDVTVSAGGSSLSFDATTNVYTYVWKTEASWAGTCRSLTVRLTDGTERSAHFRFVR